jgi:hypothetical protein
MNFFKNLIRSLVRDFHAYAPGEQLDLEIHFPA